MLKDQEVDYYFDYAKSGSYVSGEQWLSGADPHAHTGQRHHRVVKGRRPLFLTLILTIKQQWVTCSRILKATFSAEGTDTVSTSHSYDPIPTWDPIPPSGSLLGGQAFPAICSNGPHS